VSWVNEAMLGATNIELIRVPRVRDCFDFFNLDAFDTQPIDKQSARSHVCAWSCLMGR